MYDCDYSLGRPRRWVDEDYHCDRCENHEKRYDYIVKEVEELLSVVCGKNDLDEELFKKKIYDVVMAADLYIDKVDLKGLSVKKTII